MEQASTLLKTNTAKRVLVGLPLAIGVMYMTYALSTDVVVGTSFVVLLLCWREFLKLVLPGRVPLLFTFGGGLVLAVLYFLAIYNPRYFMVGISISLGVMFLLNLRDFMAAFASHPTPANSTLLPIAAAPMGLIYVLSLVMYVPKIHALPEGNLMLGIFLGGVWGCDTGAFFAGKKFGRHRMAPAISPKKTWEGLMGGTAVTMGWLIFNKFQVWPKLHTIDIVTLTLVLAPLSQLGDLAESLLKRAVDKKDTGTILPGHGGFLDRLDGYLLSGPLFYLYMSLRFTGGV